MSKDVRLRGCFPKQKGAREQKESGKHFFETIMRIMLTPTDLPCWLEAIVTVDCHRVPHNGQLWRPIANCGKNPKHEISRIFFRSELQLRSSMRAHMARQIVAFRNCFSGARKMDLEKFVVLPRNGFTHTIPLFDALNLCNYSIWSTIYSVSAPVQTGLGALQASCTMGAGSPSRDKAVVAWRWPPTLAPRLKNEWRYASTPTLGLYGLF
jgi:hypothetical protein